jgi:hypothetical protein
MLLGLQPSFIQPHTIKSKDYILIKNSTKKKTLKLYFKISTLLRKELVKIQCPTPESTWACIKVWGKQRNIPFLKLDKKLKKNFLK